MKKSILMMCFVFVNLNTTVFSQSLGLVRANTNTALPSSYNFQEYVFAEPNDQGKCLGNANNSTKIEEVFISQTHRNTIQNPFFFMIGYRPALLQLAVTGTGVAPDITVEGVLKGTSLGTLCLKGPAQLNSTINLNTANLKDYFSVTLPKLWVQDGLELKITAGTQKRNLSSEELKIGPYTELNLVRVTMNMLDYNTAPDKYPPSDNFLQELASSIPASMVRFGTFPEKLDFPQIISSNGKIDKLFLVKSKNDIDVPNSPAGMDVNATMDKFIGSIHESTGDYLSTLYVGNTLNFDVGGWGGGKSLVCAGYTGIFIHELGHALSLPHWGEGSYGAKLPNNGDYIYPYGGEDNDGGGRGKNWNFIQDTYEFVPPTCKFDNSGLERSDCMQRNNYCLESRPSGTGPWDGFGDFSALAIHRYLVGASLINGKVSDRNSLKDYQLEKQDGFPIISLKDGKRIYTRDVLQPQDKTTAENFAGGPGIEKLDQDVYLVYGSIHPTQKQANIVYKPVKFKGTLPPVIDPTNATTFQQLSSNTYQNTFYWSHDITLKLTYKDGTVLHMLNPYQSYDRNSKGDFGAFRFDVCHFSLVVPADKELLKVELYNRPFVSRGTDDSTLGNINNKANNITANNFMDGAVFMAKYEFDSNLAVDDLFSKDNELAKIYPNPFKNVLVVETDEYLQYTINIANISGQVIYKSELKDKISQIDLKNISNGMYIVTLKNKNGEAKWVKKIIKQ